MTRSFEQITRDIEYLRNIEDAVSIFLAGNIGLETYNKLMKGKSDAQEKVKALTLEYLTGLTKLRVEYESEREELLRSSKTEGK